MSFSFRSIKTLCLASALRVFSKGTLEGIRTYQNKIGVIEMILKTIQKVTVATPQGFFKRALRHHQTKGYYVLFNDCRWSVCVNPESLIEPVDKVIKGYITYRF